MKTAEKILIGLILLAFLFSAMRWPGGGVLLVLSLSALACLYYPLGAFLFNGIRLRHAFNKASYVGLPGSRLLAALGIGMVLSMLVLGMLFKWQFWPGSAIMLGLGLPLSVAVLLILLYRGSLRSDFRPFAAKAGTRLVVWSALALVLWLTPQMRLIEWRYTDQPELVEAWRAHLADPDNTALREALDKAYRNSTLNPNLDTDGEEQPG